MFENITRIRHEREREKKTTAFEFVSQIKFSELETFVAL